MARKARTKTSALNRGASAPQTSVRGMKTKQTKFAPVALNRSSVQSGRNSSRYRECERVQTVSGAVNYTVVANLACNPGLPGSFPWLAGHAALYEKYILHSVTYRYKNLKGTSSDGNIIMSFDYDTLDAAPTSAVLQTQSTVYIDGAPWRIFEMKVPAPDRSPLFIRGTDLARVDLKTYDFGRLFVAAEGCADTSDHGYLEVEYDIELFDKQTGTSGSGSSQSTIAMFNLSSSSAGSILPFNEEVQSGLNVTNASGVFTLGSSGTYLVHVDYTRNGVGDSTIHVNGSEPAIPIRSATNTSSMHGLVDSDGSTTVAVASLGGSVTWTGDYCRISFQLV